MDASLKAEHSKITLLSTLMNHKSLHLLANSLRAGPLAMAEGQFLLTLVNAWNGAKGYWERPAMVCLMNSFSVYWQCPERTTPGAMLSWEKSVSGHMWNIAALTLIYRKTFAHAFNFLSLNYLISVSSLVLIALFISLSTKYYKIKEIIISL